MTPHEFLSLCSLIKVDTMREVQSQLATLLGQGEVSGGDSNVM